MKFGICLGEKINNAELIPYYPLGADYFELSGTRIAPLSDGDFRTLSDRVERGEIKPYSCNGLIAPEYRLTGEEVRPAEIREYCKRLFERLAKLRISMLVFGSGKAKNVPEGFPMERAWEQLYDLGAMMSDEAKQYGQTIVVEPLSYQEVNIVNTVEDAARYARVVNRGNFKILVDFYHFDNNKEPYDSLRTYKDELAHVHIATSVTRQMPETDADFAFFERNIRFLASIGYAGGVSFEGKMSNIPVTAIAPVMERMRRAATI